MRCGAILATAGSPAQVQMVRIVWRSDVVAFSSWQRRTQAAHVVHGEGEHLESNQKREKKSSIAKKSWTIMF